MKQHDKQSTNRLNSTGGGSHISSKRRVQMTVSDLQIRTVKSNSDSPFQLPRWCLASPRHALPFIHAFSLLQSNAELAGRSFSLRCNLLIMPSAPGERFLSRSNDIFHAHVRRPHDSTKIAGRPQQPFLFEEESHRRLHGAVIDGNLSLLQTLLVAWKLDPNARNDRGDTAGHQVLLRTNIY